MPRYMQTAQKIGGTSVKPILGKTMTTLQSPWRPELAHILALAMSELRHSASRSGTCLGSSVVCAIGTGQDSSMNTPLPLHHTALGAGRV